MVTRRQGRGRKVTPLERDPSRLGSEVLEQLVAAVNAGCPWVVTWDELRRPRRPRAGYELHMEPIETGEACQRKLLELISGAGDRGPTMVLVYHVEGPGLVKLAARWRRELRPGAAWQSH